MDLHLTLVAKILSSWTILEHSSLDHPSLSGEACEDLKSAIVGNISLTQSAPTWHCSSAYALGRSRKGFSQFINILLQVVGISLTGSKCSLRPPETLLSQFELSWHVPSHQWAKSVSPRDTCPSSRHVSSLLITWQQSHGYSHKC